MRETPSSAVTTADDVSLPVRAARGAVAVSPMAIAIADGVVGVPTAADAAALAWHDQPPLDLLLRVPALVEFILPDDAPVYAVAGVDDWSGIASETARVARDAAPGLDLVYGADGGATHVAPDVAVVSAMHGDVALGGDADPLVDLGLLAGDPIAILMPTLDAPAPIDVTADALASGGMLAPDPWGAALSWLAALSDPGLPVGAAGAWSDTVGVDVFDPTV